MTHVPYKKALGFLQYLCTLTCCDIAFAVNYFAQFMSNLGTSIHWVKVKRIFRYLRGTIHCGLTYHGHNFHYTNSHLLRGQSDADWVGDLATCRSTSGYLFQLTSCVITWQSKSNLLWLFHPPKQNILHQLATTTKEFHWLQALLHKLGYSITFLDTLFCDNQSCIALSKNPKFHARSKYIDIRFHFLYKKVQAKLLKLAYTSTSTMQADILTISLPKVKHEDCIQGLANEASSNLKQRGD